MTNRPLHSYRELIAWQKAIDPGDRRVLDDEGFPTRRNLRPDKSNAEVSGIHSQQHCRGAGGGRPRAS